MTIPRILFAFLLASAAATAQPAATPAPPDVPIPGTVPPPIVPARPPARQAAQPAAQNQQVKVPLAETKIVEPIEEMKLNGDALAGLYSKYTGRRVIVPTAAAQAEFRFVQAASPENPLTYADAAELLKKAAILEGFVFVADDQMPEVDILTMNSTGGAIRPAGRGIDVYNDKTPLPDGDQVISYVMTLSYIKPNEAMNIFTQVIGQFSPFGSIAAVPNASAIVITENTALIRKLIDLKGAIDKPSSQVSSKFITVKYADVSEIATTLNELLTAQQSAQTTAGIQRSQPAANPGQPQIPGQINNAAPGGSASGEQTPVQIVPDPRTNRIFVMGRPVDILFVETLVRDFDIPASEKNFLRRKLRFLTVSDFLSVAQTALEREFTGTGTAGAGGGSSTGGATRSGSSNNRQSAFNSNDGGNSRNSSFGGNNSSLGGSGSFSGGRSSFGGGGGAGSSLNDPSVNTAPEPVLVGRTLLVADNITNSIVVQGPPSAITVIERLLDQLDVKSEQVMISTVFGQLNLGSNTTTGFDWLNLFNNNQLGGNHGGVGGSLLTGANSILNPSSLTSPSAFLDTDGVALKSGLSLYGLIGRDLAAYVNLLQSNSDFTVLSRPSIFTANNQKGMISSGRKIAVPTSSYNGGSGFGQNTNIEYRDVVLKLEVIPLVNDKNDITLQIALVSDDVIGESEEFTGIGKVPIIGTREILTTVTVPNNETVVLGGLITENIQDSVTGVPILSSIPGLGRLFSKNTDSKDRDELLVFIQPSIVADRTSMNDVQADMDGRYKVSDRTRSFADGPGVLPEPGQVVTNDKASRGTSKRATRSEPVQEEVAPSSESILRKSIRPIHRR